MIFFPVPFPNDDPECDSDGDCPLSEKCCPLANVKTCQTPVSTVSKPGKCSSSPPLSARDENTIIHM